MDKIRIEHPTGLSRGLCELAVQGYKHIVSCTSRILRTHTNKQWDQISTVHNAVTKRGKKMWGKSGTIQWHVRSTRWNPLLRVGPCWWWARVLQSNHSAPRNCLRDDANRYSVLRCTVVLAPQACTPPPTPQRPPRDPVLYIFT